MALPSLRSSTRIAFLDDDEHFTDAMGRGLQYDGRRLYFTRPAELDEALIEADQLLREEQRLLARIDSPRDGFSSIAEGVEYFRWADRHKIVTLLICDHAMPAENGVSVCSRHAHLGFRRVLLTGVADANVAVEAFNGGHIEAFLPKQHRDLPSELLRVVNEQTEKAMEIRGQRLSSCLAQRRTVLLRRSGVFVGLVELMCELGITEHLVVPDPLGVLGLTATGRVFWIQIEDEQSMTELAATLEDLEWPKEHQEAVRLRVGIANVEIAGHWDLPQSSCPVQSLSPADGAYCAVFELPSLGAVSDANPQRGVTGGR